MSASLDVFTRKERGNLVGLGGLQGQGTSLLWVLVTVKRAAACFFPLPYFNTASVPDSDLRQHQSYRRCWRISGKLLGSFAGATG